MRANRSFLFLTVASTVLLAIASILSSVVASDSLGSKPSHQSPAADSPSQANKTYTLYSGLWRTDGSFASTIRIKNVLVVAPMDVTPVLFMADGNPLHALLCSRRRVRRGNRQHQRCPGRRT